MSLPCFLKTGFVGSEDEVGEPLLLFCPSLVSSGSCNKNRLCKKNFSFISYFWEASFFGGFINSRFMSGSCHMDRASNDKFFLECLFWFFQPTWKADLKVVQITKMISFELMHPYNTLNVPQIVKLGCSYFLTKQTFDTKFVIWRSVQMTWTRH